MRMDVCKNHSLIDSSMLKDNFDLLNEAFIEAPHSHTLSCIDGDSSMNFCSNITTFDEIAVGSMPAKKNNMKILGSFEVPAHKELLNSHEHSMNLASSADVTRTSAADNHAKLQSREKSSANFHFRPFKIMGKRYLPEILAQSELGGKSSGSCNELSNDYFSSTNETERVAIPDGIYSRKPTDCETVSEYESVYSSSKKIPKESDCSHWRARNFQNSTNNVLKVSENVTQNLHTIQEVNVSSSVDLHRDFSSQSLDFDPNLKTSTANKNSSEKSVLNRETTKTLSQSDLWFNRDKGVYELVLNDTSSQLPNFDLNLKTFLTDENSIETDILCRKMAKTLSLTDLWFNRDKGVYELVLNDWRASAQAMEKAWKEGNDTNNVRSRALYGEESPSLLSFIQHEKSCLREEM